jgi:hypothetical protein
MNDGKNNQYEFQKIYGLDSDQNIAVVDNPDYTYEHVIEYTKAVSLERIAKSLEVISATLNNIYACLERGPINPRD